MIRQAMREIESRPVAPGSLRVRFSFAPGDVAHIEERAEGKKLFILRDGRLFDENGEPCA